MALVTAPCGHVHTDTCSFCGKRGVYLVVSGLVAICRDCVADCAQLVAWHDQDVEALAQENQPRLLS